MDITATPISQIITSYYRQEKLAEARKSAEAKMIKTAVAERVSISREALSIASSSRLPELSRQTSPVAQTSRGMRQTSSAAREYLSNQPIAEQSAEPPQEIENTSPISKSTPSFGRPETLTQDSPRTQPASVQVSAQIPHYSFPIPRELKIYIANLPKEKFQTQKRP